MRSILMATAALSLATGWQAVAIAQTATPSSKADTVTAANSGVQTTPQGQESVLQEVVVTASHRKESLQKEALQVSAVSGDALEAAGVLQPDDLNKTVPGLGLSPNGPTTQVYLRGVGTFSIAAYAESPVAVNVDQIFMSFPALIGGNFYDIDRVEVLKGPQGTLYGRNATAGAINIISNRPEFNYNGNASIEVGDYGLFHTSAAMNLPVTDTVAVRAAIQDITRDGYFTDKLGDDESYSGRFQALAKLGDSATLLLAADFIKMNGNGNPYVAVPFAQSSNPWLGPSTTTGNKYLIAADTYGSGQGIVPVGAYGPHSPFPLINNAQTAHSKVEGVRAELNWDVGIGDLTVIPAYRHYTSLGTIEPGFLTKLTGDGYQETTEARLASHEGGPLKWIVGGFWLHNNVDSYQDIYQGVSTNLLHPIETASSYAGFGEVTYSVLESLRVTGGLRYTADDKTQGGGTTILTNVIPRGPFLSPIPLPVPSSNTFLFPGTITYTNTSGKVGLEYDVTPKSMLYATASDAYRPGGFNTDIQPDTYRPEKLTEYTIGWKNRFLGDRLQLNGDVFYWDYHNHQENVLVPLKAGGFAPQTENIGSATLKGGNLDVKVKVTGQDTLSAQVEYNDAVFDTYVLNTPTQVAPVPGLQTRCAVTALGKGQSQINCSGKSFARAPKWNAVLSYDHIFNLPDESTLTGAVDAHLATSDFIAVDYIPGELQKDYAVVDISLSYAPPVGDWSVQAFVRNAGNTAVLTGGFEHPFIPGLVYSTINAPRTFGAMAKLYF